MDENTVNPQWAHARALVDRHLRAILSPHERDLLSYLIDRSLLRNRDTTPPLSREKMRAGLFRHDGTMYQAPLPLGDSTIKRAITVLRSYQIIEVEPTLAGKFKNCNRYRIDVNAMEVLADKIHRKSKNGVYSHKGLQMVASNRRGGAKKAKGEGDFKNAGNPHNSRWSTVDQSLVQREPIVGPERTSRNKKIGNKKSGNRKPYASRRATVMADLKNREDEVRQKNLAKADRRAATNLKRVDVQAWWGDALDKKGLQSIAPITDKDFVILRRNLKLVPEDLKKVLYWAADWQRLAFHFSWFKNFPETPNLRFICRNWRRIVEAYRTRQDIAKKYRQSLRDKLDPLHQQIEEEAIGRDKAEKENKELKRKLKQAETQPKRKTTDKPVSDAAWKKMWYGLEDENE